MEVLKSMMEEEGIQLPVEDLSQGTCRQSCLWLQVHKTREDSW